MSRYISVIEFKCPNCGQDIEPTEINHSDLPPGGRYDFGYTCDDCIDAMTDEEREIARRRDAEKSRAFLTGIGTDGTLEALEIAVQNLPDEEKSRAGEE